MSGNKLCISLIISILMVIKLLIYSSIMHNLYAILSKFIDICKMFSADLVNEKGNIPRRGVVPKFSDLEVISLSLAAESIGIDSESFLFSKLNYSALSLRCEHSCVILTRTLNKRKRPPGVLLNRISQACDFKSFAENGISIITLQHIIYHTGVTRYHLINTLDNAISNLHISGINNSLFIQNNTLSFRTISNFKAKQWTDLATTGKVHSRLLTGSKMVFRNVQTETV